MKMKRMQARRFFDDAMAEADPNKLTETEKRLHRLTRSFRDAQFVVRRAGLQRLLAPDSPLAQGCPKIPQGGHIRLNTSYSE